MAVSRLPLLTFQMSAREKGTCFGLADMLDRAGFRIVDINCCELIETFMRLHPDGARYLFHGVVLYVGALGSQECGSAMWLLNKLKDLGCTLPCLVITSTVRRTIESFAAKDFPRVVQLRSPRQFPKRRQGTFEVFVIGCPTDVDRLIQAVQLLLE
ncbi:MAG: hypothetical protein WC505_01640 [Patescibacteria group bacterium]